MQVSKQFWNGAYFLLTVAFVLLLVGAGVAGVFHDQWAQGFLTGIMIAAVFGTALFKVTKRRWEDSFEAANSAYRSGYRSGTKRAEQQGRATQVQVGGSGNVQQISESQDE